jgi:heme/copper-type cytochrome/quinol oxidase subunit 2
MRIQLSKIINILSCCFLLIILFVYFTSEVDPVLLEIAVVQTVQNEQINIQPATVLEQEIWSTRPFGFQVPATPIMLGIQTFHNHLMFLALFISIVVCILILHLGTFLSPLHTLPYQRKPALQFSQASLIEILWTLWPTLILIILAAPSFTLLYAVDAAITPDLTLRAIGHQWYWSYEYGDLASHFSATNNLQLQNLKWDCYLMPDKICIKNQKSQAPFSFVPKSSLAKPYPEDEKEYFPDYNRLLMTDRYVVLPVGTHIRLLVTSTDVIHSWAIPSFGLKIDAVPGRLNQLYFYVSRLGYFYGQCSEICGINHGFMPITILVKPWKYFWNEMSLLIMPEPVIEPVIEKPINPEPGFNATIIQPALNFLVTVAKTLVNCLIHPVDTVKATWFWLTGRDGPTTPGSHKPDVSTKPVVTSLAKGSNATNHVPVPKNHHNTFFGNLKKRVSHLFFGTSEDLLLPPPRKVEESDFWQAVKYYKAPAQTGPKYYDTEIQKLPLARTNSWWMRFKTNPVCAIRDVLRNIRSYISTGKPYEPPKPKTKPKPYQGPYSPRQKRGPKKR